MNSKTVVYAHDFGFADASNDRLATIEEYMTADRCVGSVFEALSPWSYVVLAEGEFQLDEDLDPIR